MDKKTKNAFALVAFGVVLYAALMNTDAAVSLLSRIFDAVFPVLLGLGFAFFLNIPMSGFEKILKRLFKRSLPPKKFIIAASLLLTLCSLLAALYFIFALIFPALIESFVNLYEKLTARLPVWIEKLALYGIDGAWLYSLIGNMDKSKLFSYVLGGAGDVFGSLLNFLYSAVSGIADIAVACVISVYTLLCKHTLKRQSAKALYGALSAEHAEKAVHFAKLIYNTYVRFFSGQCTEAFVLGSIVFFALSLFGMPYAALTAVLCGMFSFVQYLGGIAACALGAVFVGVSEPEKIPVFLLVYFAIQFLENQFIYPNIVGSSVGLGGMWTVVAAVIGGSMFGFAGVVFSIPLAAVFLSLLKDYTSNKKS